MTKKELSVVVKAVDEATGPIHAMVVKVMSDTNKTNDAAGRAALGFNKAFSLAGEAVSAQWSIVTGVIDTVVGAATKLTLVTVGLGAAAGYAGYKFVQSMHQTAKSLEEIDNVAMRLGLAVEQVSELRYIANQADVDFGSLADMMAKGQQNLAKFVYEGSGPAANALKVLNVQVRDARGGVRDINDILPDLADALNRVRDPARRTDLVKDLFGKSGLDFNQILLLGGQRIKMMREEAQRLNLVFTPEQTERANNFTDAVARVPMAWLGVKAQVLDRVIPILEPIVNKATALIASIPEAVGNISATISAGLSGDEGAKLRITEMIDSVANLAAIAIKGSGSFIYIAAAATANTIFDLLEDLAGERVTIMMGHLAHKYNEGIIKMYEALNLFGIFDMEIQAFKSLLVVMDGGLAIAEENYKRPTQMLEASRAAFSDLAGYIDAMGLAWQDLKDAIGPAAADAVAKMDQVMKFTELMAKHSVGSIQGMTGQIKGDLDGTISKWDEFTTGLGQGLQKFLDEGQRVQAWAENFASSSLTNLSNAMGSAFVDSLKDIKNWEQITRKAMANVADSVAKAASSMLAMRLIGSAIGLFAGGFSFASAPAGPAGLGGSVGAGGYADPRLITGAMANTGGLITEHGVRRFDRGGAVPGPSVDRDVVPALLTPGERVIRRAVSQRYPGQLDALNRGASPEAAFGVPSSAGGISLAVHTTVNVNAPTAAPVDQRSLERSVVAAVIAAIDRNPAIREKLRAAVA